MPTDTDLHPPKAEIRNVSLPGPMWGLLDQVAEQAGVPRSRVIKATIIQWALDNVDVVVDGGRYAITGIPRPHGSESAPVTMQLSRGEFERMVGAL